ncbi:zinc finger protein 239-like [Engraulis encrasicolus]|uniref:zinc finger protein 239-like n=1 Tax=Engraulis encrasicolus TaxID=184585 RepID=UPI002FD53F8B
MRIFRGASSQLALNMDAMKEEDIYAFLPEHLSTDTKYSGTCRGTTPICKEEPCLSHELEGGEKSHVTKCCGDERTSTTQPSTPSQQAIPVKVIKEEEQDIYDFLPEYLYRTKEEENETGTSYMKEEAMAVKRETEYSLMECNGHMALIDEHQTASTSTDHQQCATSEKRFEAEQHQRTHAPGTPFKCATCGKGFTHKGHLNRHQRTHTGERPYQCATCGKGFTQKGSLISHQRIHTGNKPYQCSTCGAAFSQLTSLTYHQKTHTGERPYQCTTCGKGFKQKCDLITHQRTHTGERPYQCSTCGKAFINNSNLISHQRIHTGERPYQCATCGKAFINNSNLISHQRIHTGERPYQCATCGKGFTTIGNLTAHQRTHTGDKPYQC